MYNLKNIWLTIAFIGFFVHSFGQKIMTDNLTSLGTRNPINKIHKNYIFNNEIVLLTDSREVGDLDILIVVLNQKKEVIQEQIIGTEAAYDRPIALFQKKGGGYWLCSNSTQRKKRTFKLYELDKSFIPIDYKVIPIDNLDEVSTLQYDVDKQNLIFTATVTVTASDTLDNMYPRLIKYDLNKHIITQTLDLNNRTDEEIAVPRKVTVPIGKLDEKTNQFVLQGYKEIERFDPLSKECNQIKCLNDDCSEMILVGHEISINFTDFWVTRIKDNSIIWEKIYKTKKGGDVAMDVFFDHKSKNILVGGVGYQKLLEEEKRHYYYYRLIQLDENGELLKSYVHKSKHEADTRSMYSQMKPIGNNYIIVGDTKDIITYSKTFAEDNIETPSDLYIALVDKDGNLKAEKVIPTKSVDIPKSCVVLSKDKMLLIFSRNEAMKILEITITE